MPFVSLETFELVAETFAGKYLPQLPYGVYRGGFNHFYAIAWN